MRKVVFIFCLLIITSCRENKRDKPLDKSSQLNNTAFFSEAIKDSIPYNWFSREFQILNEPSLLEEKESGKVIYRFTRLGSWSGPMTFRIEKVNDSIYYFYHKMAEKRYDSLNKPEYEIVHNLKGKVYQLWHKFPFDKLEKELDSINFWNLPIDIAWNHK